MPKKDNYLHLIDDYVKERHLKEQHETFVHTINFMRKELSENGHQISGQPVHIEYEKKEGEGMMRLLTHHTRLVAKTINWSQYTEELSKKVLSFEVLEEILFELLDMV